MRARRPYIITTDIYSFRAFKGIPTELHTIHSSSSESRTDVLSGKSYFGSARRLKSREGIQYVMKVIIMRHGSVVHMENECICWIAGVSESLTPI